MVENTGLAFTSLLHAADSLRISERDPRLAVSYILRGEHVAAVHLELVGRGNAGPRIILE